MALSPEQRQLLVIHLVRDPDTIRAAEPRVDESIFNAQSEIFELVCWIVSRDNFRRTGQPTPKEHFIPALMRLLNEQYPYHGLTHDSIARFLCWIYNFEEKALNYRLISPVMEEFIVSRKVEPQINELIHGGADYVEVIGEMHRALEMSRVSSVQNVDTKSLGVDVFSDAARIMTGCTPIDITLDGGICLGETVGLLGPMKGGKTSLCQSLACEFVKKDPMHRATYVTYEESGRQQWRKLLISFMNKYHRKLLEGKSPGELQPEIIPDLNNAHERLTAQLGLVDMSGAVEGQGFGGPPELATHLENLHRSGMLGQLVIIDHVLPMVRQYMTLRGLDHAKQMRHQIQEVAIMAKSLAPRLGVCIVLAHQMDAKGNKRGTQKPSHMDSAENKLFAEYLHDCLCLGVKQSDDDPVAWLNLSATRSKENKAVMVLIAGWRCRVDLAKGWTLDETGGGRFVKTEEREHGRRATHEETGRVTHGSTSSDLPDVVIGDAQT